MILGTAPLGVDFACTAALAVWLGWAGPKPWKRAAGPCFLLGLVGWMASYVLVFLSPSFGGDTTIAEDYINGFGLRNATVEMAVALAWTIGWFGAAQIMMFTIRHLFKGAA